MESIAAKPTQIAVPLLMSAFGINPRSRAACAAIARYSAARLSHFCRGASRGLQKCWLCRHVNTAPSALGPRSCKQTKASQIRHWNFLPEEAMAHVRQYPHSVRDAAMSCRAAPAGSRHTGL